MNSDPKISVVIATKNSERFLKQAMRSVADQSFQNFEVIVVDANSDDASISIASSYPKVRCIQQVSRGFALAWNEAIDIARGEFIAILDSDDIWHPQKLEKQLDRFSSEPENDCVSGRVQFFLESGEACPIGFKESLLQGTHIAYMPGASLVRRTAFDRFGKFEARWQITTDLVWFANLKASGAKVGVIDDVVLRKRVHSNNLSYVTSWPVYRDELMQHLRESLARRRGLPIE